MNKNLCEFINIYLKHSLLLPDTKIFIYEIVVISCSTFQAVWTKSFNQSGTPSLILWCRLRLSKSFPARTHKGFLSLSSRTKPVLASVFSLGG